MTNSLEVEQINFPNGNSAGLMKVSRDAEVEAVIEAFAWPAPRAVLVVNGGTAELDPNVQEPLGKLFTGLARVVVEEKITVVTGATNAGIFALFGEALQKQGGPTAPCIGVTITGSIGPEHLESHHTHFVLVEGNHWGEETALMYRLVAVLAHNCPSLAVFASGGSITLQEMQQNIAQNREMVLIAGSGRITDAAIKARSDTLDMDGRVVKIAQEGRITTFTINQPAVEFVTLIHNRLLAA